MRIGMLEGRRLTGSEHLHEVLEPLCFLLLHFFDDLVSIYEALLKALEMKASGTNYPAAAV